MARRLGDPDLLQLALQATFTATWCPATAQRRLALATEGVALAERVGDDRARATCLTLKVVALGELGEVARMHELCAQARALARRLRMPYLLIVLGCTSAPWLAMAGDDAEAAAVLDEIVAVGENATLPHSDDGIRGVTLVVRVHQGELAGVLAGMQQMAGHSALPLTSVVCLLLLRAGLVEQARSYLDDAGLDLDHDDWFSLLTWCAAGEVAAGLRRAELGAAAYARAVPYAGRPATAGSSGPLGPVDAFLALAAVAAGERDTATRHADDAERLCVQWQVPRAAQWVRDLRDRHGI